MSFKSVNAQSALNIVENCKEKEEKYKIIKDFEMIEDVICFFHSVFFYSVYSINSLLRFILFNVTITRKIYHQFSSNLFYSLNVSTFCRFDTNALYPSMVYTVIIFKLGKK